jgi:hypothetical protein
MGSTISPIGHGARRFLGGGPPRRCGVRASRVNDSRDGDAAPGPHSLAWRGESWQVRMPRIRGVGCVAVMPLTPARLTTP